jgi:hypothetical protein
MEKMFHLGNLTFLFRAQQTGQEFIDIESAAEVVEDNRIDIVSCSKRALF